MGNALVIKNVSFSENKLDTVEFNDRVPCTGISLNKQSVSFTSFGSTETLVATALPADTTDQIVWTTSDPTIATVNNGVVAPVGKLGQATITVTCGSYSATCTVVVDDVVPDYVAVCGYIPFKRSASLPFASTGKKTTETNANYIIAADQASGLYPIESKSDVDTSPYRFVPILIPDGAKSIIVNDTRGNIKTAFLWFDSTKVETYSNIGAYCLSGRTDESYEQSTSVPGPVTKVIPTDLQDLDSFCMGFATGGSVPIGTAGEDYSAQISIKFSTSES